MCSFCVFVLVCPRMLLSYGAGVEIWRVENHKREGNKAAVFGVKKLPLSQHGKLYTVCNKYTYNGNINEHVQEALHMNNRATRDGHRTCPYSNDEKSSDKNANKANDY